MQESLFQKLVEESLLELPERIRQKMENVSLCVEKKPTAEQLRRLGTRASGVLLGLYEGVPKTAYGRGFGMRLPDKITIFQEAIVETASHLSPRSTSSRSVVERSAVNPEAVKKLVRNVVWHEVAHHFGFNEKQVRELERRRGSTRKRISKL